MIFASQDPESKGFVVFLTVIVAIINVGMLVWLVVQMVREYTHEQKEEAAANDDGAGSSFSQLISNARDSVQRWRFNRMTPEAQQRVIRSRTVDAADGNTAENPVTIEMSGIYNGEPASEIKVDDGDLDSDSTIKKSETANQAANKRKKKKNYITKSNKRRQSKQVPVRKTAAQQARSEKLRSFHTKRLSSDAGNDGKQ